MVNENPESPQNIDGLSASPSSGPESVPQKEVSMGGIFKDPTPDKPEKKSKKKLMILTIVLGLLVVGGGIGLGGWYYLGQQEKMKKTETKPPEAVSPPEEKPAEAEAIPAGFKKIVLNGTEVYYPEAWGAPSEKKATTEKMGSSDDPRGSYTGEYAYFKQGEEYVGTIEVNDRDSYNKDLSAGGYHPTKSTMSYLESLYESQTVNPEDVYALPQDGYLSPGISMYNNVYNPRYIESKNGKWRGYWYINGTGNGNVPNLGIMLVMYNKDTGKVLSIKAGIKTEQYQQFVLNQPDWSGDQIAANKWRENRDSYIQSAYSKDSDLKNKVDNTYLKIVEYIK